MENRKNERKKKRKGRSQNKSVRERKCKTLKPEGPRWGQVEPRGPQTLDC